jgi:Tfp pilus assembly protein PilX
MHPERGIALVTALLVLLLISVIGVTFMMTSVSERAMSSNVQVARGSLLAADAGVRAAQQVLANTARAKLDTLLSLYTGSGPIVTNPSTLFPATTVYTTSTNPSFSAVATVAWADSDLADSAQVYDYRYQITSTGSFGGAGHRQVQSSGLLRVSADRGTFAQYLVFANQFLTPSGGAIWFTSDARFDGRVHTNSEFRFAYEPQFLDKVSSVNTKAYFYNKGSPKELAANNNGTIDVPQFGGGFQRGAPSVPLPTNSFNQQNAALGLTVTGSSPSNSTINGILGTGAGSGTPPNGIYVVHDALNTMTGGLYIQGSLDQCLATADTVNHVQRYVMRQGTTTKTIVIDPTANTTSVTEGTTTTTYTGVPKGITYVNGQLKDLRGPDRVSGSPPPAILAGQQTMITATDDIILQRDVTVNNYTTGQAVLGLYSSGGNVRVGTSAPNDMYLDAYVMATGNGTSGEGWFGVDNYSSGSPRGTFHLRGGMVAQYYGAFYTFNSNGTLKTGYARDFKYDRRGLIPPYFPTTTLYVQTDTPNARTLAWKEL